MVIILRSPEKNKYLPWVVLFAVIVLVYLLRSSTMSCSRCSEPFGFMLAHPCKRLGIGINYEFVPSGVGVFSAPGAVVGLMAPPFSSLSQMLPPLIFRAAEPRKEGEKKPRCLHHMIRTFQRSVEKPKNRLT